MSKTKIESPEQLLRTIREATECGNLEWDLVDAWPPPQPCAVFEGVYRGDRLRIRGGWSYHMNGQRRSELALFVPRRTDLNPTGHIVSAESSERDGVFGPFELFKSLWDIICCSVGVASTLSS